MQPAPFLSQKTNTISGSKQVRKQANDQTGAFKSSSLLLNRFHHKINSYTLYDKTFFHVYLWHDPCPFVLQTFSNHPTSLAEEISGYHTVT